MTRSKLFCASNARVYVFSMSEFSALDSGNVDSPSITSPNSMNSKGWLMCRLMRECRSVYKVCQDVEITVVSTGERHAYVLRAPGMVLASRDSFLVLSPALIFWYVGSSSSSPLCAVRVKSLSFLNESFSLDHRMRGKKSCSRKSYASLKVVFPENMSSI